MMIIHKITANIDRPVITHCNSKCLRVSIGSQVDPFPIFPITGSIIKPTGNINIISMNCNCFSLSSIAWKFIYILINPIAGFIYFPLPRSIYRTINNSYICCPGSTGKFIADTIYPVAGCINTF